MLDIILMENEEIKALIKKGVGFSDQKPRLFYKFLRIK